MEPRHPPQRISLSAAHWAAMRAHVAALAPEEACGIVAGRDGQSLDVVPLENVLHSSTRYRIAPEAQFQAFAALMKQDQELLAIFHSHPHGPARPSRIDIAEAFYPNTAYLIWAPAANDWICRAFRIADDEVEEISLRVAPSGD